MLLCLSVFFAVYTMLYYYIYVLLIDMCCEASRVLWIAEFHKNCRTLYARINKIN
jgi:hypothetical protein